MLSSFEKCNNDLDWKENNKISTISESFSQHPDETYDTDPTDIDCDEIQLRRKLIIDKWKSIFDSIDPEGFGEIAWDDFISAINFSNIQQYVPVNKQEELYYRTSKKGSNTVSFQDFVEVMSGKRSYSFKCAVHCRDREVSSNNDFHLIVKNTSLLNKMAHIVAVEVLPEERDRKYYADNYSCVPPPLFVICITLIEVHGSSRIGCIYIAGVLAGSLGTSVFDPEVYLVGSSGGVYSLLAAHLANVLLNFHNMQYGIIRLFAIIVCASCDVGFAIYSRYALDVLAVPSVSYVAHLTGAFAGLTIGLLVLKNFDQKLKDQMLWWVALGVYAAFTVFCILFNLFNTEIAQKLEEEGGHVIKQHLFQNFGV
ncbi:uncharacterized protein LOC134829305 isoform X2 [Culicoides brevitarsis]|uniref:uncharacterized protein LOC134829305 isoform X2 n=1 Tax=Culicoides brevitarsis TaxID=469753 RepID=UPI00307B6874